MKSASRTHTPDQEVDQSRIRSGSVRSSKSGSRPALTNNGALIIPPGSCGSRRGSLLLIDGRTSRSGSFIQVPEQQVQVRRGSIIQILSDHHIR